MFRRRSRDTGSSRRGGGIPPAPDVHTLVNDFINQLGEPPKGVAMMPICVEVPTPTRWVFHVVDLNKVIHTVIATDWKRHHINGPFRSDQALSWIVFQDTHPLAPAAGVFFIREDLILSIEVVRKANRPEDEPVAAWTSESDLPRPEACSESVQ